MDERRLDPEVAAFARAHRWRWLNWAGPILAALAIFGGIALYAALFSKPALRMGDPCERSRECGPKAMCLITEEASICAPYCEKPTDCPPGYSCKMSQLINESGQKAGGWMLVCMKN
jgi:hypothetical protein